MPKSSDAERVGAGQDLAKRGIWTAQGMLNAISIVQRGNLKALETTLRKQWRMGQNIVLCWSSG